MNPPTDPRFPKHPDNSGESLRSTDTDIRAARDGIPSEDWRPAHSLCAALSISTGHTTAADDGDWPVGVPYISMSEDVLPESAELVFEVFLQGADGAIRPAPFCIYGMYLFDVGRRTLPATGRRLSFVLEPRYWEMKEVDEFLAHDRYDVGASCRIVDGEYLFTIVLENATWAGSRSPAAHDVRLRLVAAPQNDPDFGMHALAADSRDDALRSIGRGLLVWTDAATGIELRLLVPTASDQHAELVVLIPPAQTPPPSIAVSFDGGTGWVAFAELEYRPSIDRPGFSSAYSKISWGNRESVEQLAKRLSVDLVLGAPPHSD